jgi:hypothetical protein
MTEYFSSEGGTKGKERKGKERKGKEGKRRSSKESFSYLLLTTED